MGNALAWIGSCVEWFGKFIPRWRVLDTTEGAVKFIKGKKVKAVGPGIVWWWPAVTVINVYPTARQADKLPIQTMCTTDDKVIIVGGMLVYKVDDLGALLSTTHSAVTAIKDICLSAIHDVCCGMSWAELKDEQRRGTLDTKLKNAAQKQLTEYGVRVVKLMLTDLAPCRVYRMAQSTQAEETS